jgi:hypothetical protein
MVSAHKEVICSSIAPLKISLFSWSLINSRLSTKENLARQGLAIVDTEVCLGCCVVDETSNHLFLGCDFITLCGVTFGCGRVYTVHWRMLLIL